MFKFLLGLVLGVGTTYSVFKYAEMDAPNSASKEVERIVRAQRVALLREVMQGPASDSAASWNFFVKEYEKKTALLDEMYSAHLNDVHMQYRDETARLFSIHECA